MFGAELGRAQQSDNGLADQERADLFHEVQRQAESLASWCVRDVEGRLEPCGVERTDGFGQEDRVPVGQGGVRRVGGGGERWWRAWPVPRGSLGSRGPSQLGGGLLGRCSDCRGRSHCRLPCKSDSLNSYNFVEAAFPTLSIQ